MSRALVRDLRAALIGAVFPLFFAGCTAAPKATVELSEIIDKQIAEMQRSHEAFVERYYSKLRDDVDRFMLEKWTPSFLAKAVDNEKFRKTHDKYYDVAQVDAAAVTFDVSGVSDASAKTVFKEAIEGAVKEQKAQWGKTMIGFGEAAVFQIQKKRQELIQPIDDQERLVLGSLRDGYADLVRASMTIKGYLQSVANLREQQDQILEKTKLLDARNSLLNRAVELNDTTVRTMNAAKDGMKGLDTAKAAFDQANAELKKIAKREGQ